jgi:hypothetical protein
VVLCSLKDRKMDVFKDADGKWVARIPINGVLANLTAVHVELGTGWIPKVLFVEIYGADDSGGVLYEKKVP